MTIPAGRLRVLDDRKARPDGTYVLYLMQQSNRAHGNPALEYAIAEANARHYAFLLQGLADAARGLRERGIAFVIRKASPAAIAVTLAGEAALLVLDRGYLAIQKRWYAEIAAAAETRLVQVEGDVVVPVEVASSKHEVAARTLRPKLGRLMDDYIAPLDPQPVRHRAEKLDIPSEIDIGDPDRVLAGMSLDRTVPPVRRFKGGESEARRRLATYLAGPFAAYGTDRNRPEAAAASHMSPYLHFGQISPVEIALAVRAAKVGGPEDKASYLEELVVRRELAMNHVHYTQGYDDYARAVPEWARKVLAEHAGDPRPYAYTDEDLAEGRTHDLYWNAAQAEMRVTGYMHNHLRMYWGKKILEWSPSPEEGFLRTLRLNNRYFLDGRDPNSFTNVAWIYGLHDRPWARRKVFGTVRYQSENSLRKFDAKAYLKAVERLCAAES